MKLPQLNLDQEKGPKAIISTTMGAVEIQLFPKQAPKTVKNFVELAKQGYYNGVIFHRVIPDFMIQGGDPTGTGRGGESIYGKSFEDEFSKELFNLYGALSMANSGPDTNGSQFFIVSSKHVPDDMIDDMDYIGYPEEIINYYKDNGGTPWLDFRHTVFGQVVDGMDVVEAISKVKRDISDKPRKDVVIKKILIEE
ncbi:MAG: peptidylprolyl isomerase [Limosilactobacillus sp.]|uniref:peptidylprolyl isomerase n=1 Tax=Limosilactobacillus sp. TaxID=2773925 RepID=UPI00270FC9CC|nr:peptidylprolyl isomerase [Limosilactobacillus sp.]